MSDRPPCDCGCANVFGSREAENDLKRYREKGPDPTTEALIDAIVAQGIEGATILDIGGGVGAIQWELLSAGAARTQLVDVSPTYVEVARAEAERRGLLDRTSHRVADFVAIAGEVPPADVVTLDRVVCCYSDMPALLGQAAEHARRMIGIVYPPSTWYHRSFALVGNALARLFRQALRFYIHPDREIDRTLRDAGFTPQPVKRTLIWQVVLYRRNAFTKGIAGAVAERFTGGAPA
jgi:predicted TPR repeat methyltransferase